MRFSQLTAPALAAGLVFGTIGGTVGLGAEQTSQPTRQTRPAAAAPAQSPLQPATPIAASDWPNHGRDRGESRFSPLTQINASNVGQLQVAWVYDTRVANAPAPGGGGDPDPMAEGRAGARGGRAGGNAAAGRAGGAGRGGGAGAAGAGQAGASGRGLGRQWEATPIMIDGILYMGTAYNRVVALDPETGREIWVKDIGHAPATRGISYWPGEGSLPAQIIVGTGDAYLVALNAKTGELVESFGNKGLVDMQAEIVAKYEYAGRRVGLSSPPVIYKNIAITGARAQEAPSLGPPADIRGWDLKTGKLLWTFHTVPRPGEFGHETWTGDQWKDRGGANVWGLMTVDDERGIVYCPVANPTTDFYGGDRLGNNLFGSTLLAIDATTGKMKWYYQTTHHDVWDYDLTAPPTLIDVKQNGRTIPAISLYTKQGLLFIFDRVTGKPIYGVEERAVKIDNVLPGDVYSPTQPFPIKPAPLARNTFSPEEIATVTPEHEKFCKAMLALEGGAMTGGPYAIYGPRPRVIFPGWTGGGNWTGGAFNGDLGYYFINSQDHGMLNKMVPSPTIPGMWIRKAPDGAPSSMGTNFWDGDTGWPCQTPPWGELLAVNVNTGDIAWRVPLGSYEALDKLGVPATGTINRGGPITTAGGLVFIAASQDARFRAFDAKTGKVLWTANITESGRTIPITYMGKNGKQYVAVLAASGEVPKGRKVDPQKLGGRLFVFALPEAGAPTVAPGTILDAENVRPVNAAAVPPPPAPAAAPAAPAASVAPAPASALPAAAANPAPAPSVSAAASAPVSPEVDARQRGLLERTCSECHGIEQVTSNRLTRARWIEVVNEMAGRGAQATDPEFDAIIEYLVRNYGPEQ